MKAASEEIESHPEMRANDTALARDVRHIA